MQPMLVFFNHSEALGLDDTTARLKKGVCGGGCQG